MKNYHINLVMQSEPVIDFDEFECIVQQMNAIQRGWGLDFKVFTQEEEIVTTYIWENPNASTTGTSCATSWKAS